MGGMAQEANAWGNAQDMLTWAGCSRRQGLSTCQGFRHTACRSESRTSFGTSSMTIAFAKPLDWKGSVAVVLMTTA